MVLNEMIISEEKLQSKLETLQRKYADALEVHGREGVVVVV